MAGFTWAYDLTGADLIEEKLTVKDTIVLSKGEMVSLDTGEADAGATGDTTFIGPALHDVDNTDDGLTVRVSASPYAVYKVEDANARAIGATLDLGTGGLTVASTNNADLIVVRSSSATEPTYVCFNQTHFLT